MRRILLYISFLLFVLTGRTQLLVPTENSLCENLNFGEGNFTNWTGYTSVYPRNTPGANIGNRINYYYDEGIVDGRHTIITTSEFDPFTCGNVTTIAPGETQSVRLGNGGIGDWGNGVSWQRDYLEYTIGVTESNALLVYKYAVVLQDPNSDPGIAPHADPIKPRFVVTIKDESDALIDPTCGIFSVTADETVDGFRNCTQGEAQALGGRFNSRGSTIYRAWTTVGVDLREFIGQDVTLLFETWDCGLGGHFGYAYMNARCDSLGIFQESCGPNDGVTLTAPEGFSYTWSTGQSTQTIDVADAQAGDTIWVDLTTKSGCTSSLYTVLNPAKIQSAFTVSDNSICVGEPVTFIDSSWSKFLLDDNDIAITDKKWRFSDGTVFNNNTSAATHTFSSPGNYSVTLIVENNFGCVDSITKAVKVNSLPVASFNFNSNCVGEVTAFESTSLVQDGFINSWQWVANNNEISTSDEATYTFSKTDAKEMKLIVASSFGCVDSTQRFVELWPNPIANFSSNTVCAKSPTSFTNLSTSVADDAIASYRWDFGNGSPQSTLRDPVAIYDSSKVYDVKLSIVTSRGCKADTVKVAETLELPLIDFEFGTVCVNEPVQFINTTQSTAAIQNWNWDFGDQIGSSTLKEPAYAYLQNDAFEVSLKAVNTLGCFDSLVKVLEISSVPTAQFRANEVCVGSPTVFTNQSVVNQDFSSRYSWTINNEEFADSIAPKYILDSAGTFDVQLKVVSGSGCADSVIEQVVVKPGPLADFVADTVCFGNTTSFENKTTSTLGSAVAYFWDFKGMAPQRSVQNPKVVFGASGVFEVDLRAVQASCENTITKEVLIREVPLVDFEAAPVCLGIQNQFINKSQHSTEALSWDWTIITTNTKYSTFEPFFTVNQGSSYDVELIGLAGNGCADTLTKIFDVNPSPVLDFVYQSDCAGEAIEFLSTAKVSSGNIVNYTWLFNDSITNNDVSVNQVFNANGEAKLIVTTSGGCVDSVTKPVVVFPNPVASFEAVEVCFGAFTNFSSSSSVNSGNITQQFWDVGDGSLLKTQSSFDHRYQNPGEFTASLAVVTDQGCKDTMQQTVFVFETPVPNFSNSLVCFDTETEFYNSSLNQPSIKLYDWNFGDGNTSNDFEPTNVYSITGAVDVTLSITDTNDCVGAVAKQVIVKPKPLPSFDSDIYNGCNPQTISFTDFSSAPLDTITEWKWDFGNGDTATDRNPTIYYDQDGVYDVSLQVTTQNGCSNSFTDDSMITIYKLPEANFSFNPTEPTILNARIEFADLSMDAEFYRWDFGDGRFSSFSNPVNRYDNPGDYNITQIVTTNFGCADTIIKPIKVEPVFKVTAANAFTPNNDDLNDGFRPSGIGFNPDPEKYTFQVFNRWGILIFETNDINAEWDGRVNTFNLLNTGKVAQVDVYVWKLIVHDITSKKERHVIVGTVALLN